MRDVTTVDKIRALMEKLGERATGAGRIYFSGGTSALLIGWRDTTVDVDLKMEPEPRGIFEALATLKDELDINVELAAPDQFIPAIPAWQDRSAYISTVGPIDFYHYDFYGQFLSKLERGHTRDLEDARAMLDRRLVTRERALEFFQRIRPDLVRYPAIDAAAFEQKVRDFLAER
jgi:hypothetical protein